MNTIIRDIIIVIIVIIIIKNGQVNDVEEEVQCPSMITQKKKNNCTLNETHLQQRQQEENTKLEVRSK